MAIVLAWLLCAILTVTGAVPNDPSGWSYNARTDVKIGVLHDAAWFRFPYPCKLQMHDLCAFVVSYLFTVVIVSYLQLCAV